MARKQVSRKRRVKKNIENGVAHIRSTFNNTIVTITDEFRTPRGYGSVWIVAAGIEPAPIGALPITIRAAIRYMTSIFTVACLLARH